MISWLSLRALMPLPHNLPEPALNISFHQNDLQACLTRDALKAYALISVLVNSAFGNNLAM